MFRFIAIWVLLAAPLWAHALEPARYSVGAAMESTVQEEVNPEFTDMKYIPMLFAIVKVAPWSVLAEVGQESRDSSSGSLRISSQSTNVAVWGRYEFLPDLWSPYLSLGGGAYFDRVNTQFQASSDTRTANRLMAGAGAGISAIFWKYLVVEAEGRAASVQQSKDFVYSGLIRVGLGI